MEQVKLEGNFNTEYEKLAREIYLNLLAAEGFENIEVVHNSKIQGKSGCKHQIDVYWEFKIAGEINRYAIECKNYSETVPIGKVRDFFGVVHDIGNIKGIFVSKLGFQSGAKTFADYYGLSLKEIREPDEEDWNGRLKSVKVEVNIYPTEVTDWKVDCDIDWLIASGFITSPDEKILVQPTSNINAEILIFDENGEVYTNFLDLEQNLPHNYKEGKGFKHTYAFENHYLETNKGRIKVKKIDITYDILLIHDSAIADGAAIVKAIIKDVKSGETKFINKDGSVK